MQELFRVLKKGGTLIAQVPLDESRESTFEDDSIVDYHERTKIFGQYDHVATSIIPLENIAPRAIPMLAKIMMLRKEMAFDPMAEFKKLTASLLTPTIKSPMAKTANNMTI